MTSRTASGLFVRALTALCVLTAFAANVHPATAQPTADAGGMVPAKTAAIYRATVRLTQPSDRVRLDQLGVRVLAESTDSAVVLADDLQLEALARQRFQPSDSSELGALAAAAQGQPWLVAGVQGALSRAAALQASNASDDVPDRVALRAAVQALSPAVAAALASAISPDADGDGLTNTEEAWWCTDPLNPNTDGDANGWSDGLEVRALLDFTLPRSVRWGYGPPFGPPNAWPDFNGADGNPSTPACNDGDYDTIPDYAEVYMVGTRVPEESTDHDKFDDGQELFGVTFCPGGNASCGYGVYPRTEYANFIAARMPDWVLPPGDNPLVAAFPVPEVSVTPGSWHVERVTTITTSQGEMTQASHSYETSVTQGQSTSIADTVTWNNWEELSQAVEAPIPTTAGIRPKWLVPVVFQVARTFGPRVALGVLRQQVGSLLAKQGLSGILKTIGTGVATSLIADKLKEAFSGDDEKDSTEINNTIQNVNINNISSSAEANASVVLNQNFDFQGIVNSLDGVQYAINQQGELLARGLYDISYAISQPRLTETRTNGRSWGGAQTTTHEVYEEHSISEGEAFTSGQNWSTAWAVDSSHAANLTFEFSVKNTGTEYARELSGIVVNVYIGDDTRPAISYPAWQKFPSGKLENLFPIGPNTPPGQFTTRTFTSDPIALSLEQMKRIDMGERLTVKVESYSYGTDEMFYTNAVNGGVTVFIEDGVEDGDETVDTYVIPTWAAESVQDVLARYFRCPSGRTCADADGNLNALWTPEYDGINPPAWREHYLSDIAWWNVYLTQADAGDTPLKDLSAQAGSGILFRFNRDSDRDGYNDRAEFRYYCALPTTDPEQAYCADAHLHPEIHPQPQVSAGYVAERSGNVVTVKLAVQNTGTFDAYGVDAVMYSPDGTTTIGNNTVGGNGRARPGHHVAVGSLIKPPDLANWGSSTTKPYAGGQFSGAADRVFTFTVEMPGVVGQGNASMRWSDGAGGSAVIPLGSSYHAPLPVNVAQGLQVGFSTGTLAAGARFTVQALTPRDTFTYTVNTDPFTPPVIVVSYSDPQGSHRFVTPVVLPDLSTSIAAGQMLEGLQLEIVTPAPLNATGVNTTHLVVNNPHPATIQGGHLYLNFVSDGKLVREMTHTLDIPAGPTVFPASWSVTEFSAGYHPTGDNLLIAFWTDSEGNIIDSAARPLNSFAADPDPVLAMANADATWNFGTVAQGTLLKREFTLANTGQLDLLTYVSTPPGVSLSQTGSRRIGPADATAYEIALNTAGLPLGAYDQTITLRSSDPGKPMRTVRVMGTITAGTPDTQGGASRPLDWPVTVTGDQSQGTWWTYSHALGPDPASLHPVKVYNDTRTQMWGVGRYATDFSAGTASAEMFGDGRDGTMPSSGNLNNNNGFGIGLVSSGTAGSVYINATDYAYAWRIKAGDAILIHQTRGTNAGCWELNKMVTDFIDGAANQLTKPLQCNYSSDGNNRAQIIRVPQYSTCDVTGTMTPFAGWNGNWGGIFAIMCNASMNVSGHINASGNTTALPQSGNTGRPSGGVGSGFQGGAADAVNNDGLGTSQQGENHTGTQEWSHLAVGNGGGGGGFTHPFGVGPGGGGGNGTAGTQSCCTGGSTFPGQGGQTAGNAELTNMVFGGGGGGGAKEPSYSSGGGGSGGGIIFIAATSLNVNTNPGSYVSANGGNGANADGAGGAGAGGSILLRAKTIVLNDRIQAYGGTGGVGQINGGNGGNGRIRVEYCESITGSDTQPSASIQKLTCHIAEQIEAAPHTQGRLNLPETVNGSRIYQVQYGRKIDYAVAASQIVTLRVPAGMFSTVNLQALASNLTGDAAIALDVGNTGVNHWTGTLSNASQYTSTNLAAPFNTYWASRGSPTTGTFDVPVRVSLDRSGQILLTNLQVQTSSSALRRIRLADRTHTSATLNLTISGSGSHLVALAADVGDNGSIDWTWSDTASLPRTLNSANLAGAVNTYLAGRTGDVDVPIRFFLSPASSSLTLNSFSATPSQKPDLAARPPSFSASTPVEASPVTVTAVVSNTGSLPSSGAVASFFAVPPGWTDTYLGSTFVPPIPAGGTAAVTLTWNTLSFTGSLPVRLVVDPYNRLAETSEANNTVTATLTILSRPDLRVISFTLSNDEPVVGERVTVTLRIQNAGQTNAPAGSHALYLGNPDSGGGLIASRTAAVGAGAATNLAYTWVPTATGPVRLHARLDRNNQVNEFDKGNNDAWIDRYVGFAGARRIDSGNPVSDTLYTPAAGYGAVDTGIGDRLLNCGASPDQTYRLAPDGTAGYRFGHLQPGHYYHLDLVLYECGQNAGRQQRVKVDGNLVGGPYDLGNGTAHRLSFLVDPALYASDRSIHVTVEENSDVGAVVNYIALHDIDYRYADAGGSIDPPYPGTRAYGWLGAISDTAALSSCGTLPHQTVRVNQTGNMLRYRWDRLDPARRYRLNFTFFQCSGATLQQQIQVDGQVLGADLLIPANTLVTATRSVPRSAYLGDGSVTLSVVRQNASVGARLGEVALEEETSLAPASCDGLVRTTPYWTQAYGAVTVTGQLAPAGSLVTAEDPRGNVVGCFVASSPGQYGLMSVYGEDAAAAPGVGMRTDETVLFRVDGALAVASPPLRWRSDSNFHLVNLDAGAIAAQPILLAPGWNLPSFRVEPPVPLVDTVLRSIAGKFCRVLGETGAYDCSVPVQYRTLKDLRAGRAYYLHVTNTASVNLLVEGVTVSPTTPVRLHPGWNWIGYLPSFAMPVTVALQTIAGLYQRVVDGQGRAYVPALPPQFNTLTQMEPGQGYLIFANVAATLVYPASPPTALASPEQARAPATGCPPAQPTPFFTLLYGRLRVNGVPAPSGTRIEAVAADGRSVGCALAREGGEFGLMPVFGADGTVVPGYAEGQPITLRVDGARLADAGVAWSDDKDTHTVEAAAGPVWLRLPIALRP